MGLKKRVWQKYLTGLLIRDGFITEEQAALWADMYSPAGQLRSVRHGIAKSSRFVCGGIGACLAVCWIFFFRSRIVSGR